MNKITKDSLRLYVPKKRIRVTDYGGECKNCPHLGSLGKLRYATKDGKCILCKKQMKKWLGFNDQMSKRWEKSKKKGRSKTSDEAWLNFMKRNGARVYAKV